MENERKMNKAIEEHKEAVNFVETPTSCSWCKYCIEVELNTLLCRASEDQGEWFEIQLYSSCDLFEPDPLMCEDSPLEKTIKGVTMEEARAINAIEQELEEVRFEFSKEKRTKENAKLMQERMNTVLLSAQDAGRILLGNPIKVKVTIINRRFNVEYPKWVKERKFL